MPPRNPDNHDESHKYPFAACEVLANCNKVIEALVDGGNDRKQDEQVSFSTNTKIFPC